MRLLLVDDDSGFRALLRTTFEDVEVDVDEAGSAAEAEQRISAQRPDVIVLDVGMPGMDGLAFCRELKESPDTSAIRIVLLTGMEDVEDVAGAAGADALLLKPFRPLELLGVVERLAGATAGAPMRSSKGRSGEEQLVLYARDLRHLVEIERAQRGLLESAY
jgi:CheY-like chemotaxis protein